MLTVKHTMGNLSVRALILHTSQSVNGRPWKMQSNPMNYTSYWLLLSLTCVYLASEAELKHLLCLQCS